MNPDELRAQLHDQLGLSVSSVEITMLHSHASYRSYYRAELPDGSSYIVMEIPGGKWSMSEEVTASILAKSSEQHELPFLNITRYLANKGFPVPQVLTVSREKGLIVLEDLGDQILGKVIQKQTLDEKLHYYRQAIALLVDLQNKTDLNDDCIAFQRHFDVDLLYWELEHFFEYGIEKRLDRPIMPEDRKILERMGRTLCFALTQLPQVFVHRDFQSRNLMLHEEKLWLIDFQDALKGPVTYDLVALLRDSYVQLDRRLKETLIDEFLEQQQKRYDQTLDREFFLKMFDWTTIQRKLKDAGRFVYIDREKGNPDFLQYIPTSLAYVKEAFAQQGELKEFYGCLKKYVPEWN